MKNTSVQKKLFSVTTIKTSFLKMDKVCFLINVLHQNNKIFIRCLNSTKRIEISYNYCELKFFIKSMIK